MASDLVPRPSNPPVDITIRDFKADRALGRSSLYGDIANAAAEKICSLYGKSPSSVVRTIPFGSGSIDNSRGIFDDLCEDIAPLPPPPQSQFSGGQCPDVVYRVFFNCKLKGEFTGDGRITTIDFPGSDDLYGPISGGSLDTPGQKTYSQGTVQGFSRGLVGSTGRFNSRTPPGTPTQVIGSAQFEIQSIAITNIQRMDGQPDNCGNPAPSYPPANALPDDLDGTTVINISPNVPVTVPVRVAPTFAPTALIFKPEFNVDVGGINVNISGGGFTFSPTVQIQPNVNFPVNDPRPNPPAPIAISPPSGGTPQPTDLTPVIDRLDDLLAREDECCVPEEPDENDPKYLRKTVSTMALNAGSVALPEGTYKVRLLMTVIPEGAKSQWGGGQPDVYFAGHAWFSSEAAVALRTPIDAESKQFIIPNKSQNTFIWSYNVGYLGIATVYYRELRE